MRKRFGLMIVLAWMGTAFCAAANEVQVGDAFACADATNQTWAIGTKAVQVSYACKDGLFELVSFKNTLAGQEQEYVSATTPFGTTSPSTGPFTLEKVWSKPLAAGEAADPANLRLSVKTGDLIGFGAATYADDAGATINWMTTVDYGDGEKHRSSDDSEINQGPLWYYYTTAPRTGFMDTLDEVLQSTTSGQDKTRVPGGYRAPGECPSLGVTGFHLRNGYKLVRVFKAPKDGTVAVQGVATHTEGSVKVNVCILRITEQANPSVIVPEGQDRWTVESGTVQQVTVGGRPAVQLDIVLDREGLRAHLFVQAYPGTSILRQWAEFENTTNAVLTLDSPTPMVLRLRGDNAASITNYWMYGGTSRPNQGQLDQAEVENNYHRALLGDRTDNYVPWMALTRQDVGTQSNGLFVSLDYLGTWTLGLSYDSGQGILSAAFPALTDYALGAGERLRLPLITLGAFNGDLDDMGRRVYDWQYEYLWDYTNSDYYARTKWVTPWFFCSRNLQEQFTARLAGLDMDADLMRTMGMEILWDDAGWSKYPGWPIEDSYAVVFSPTYEGPDFAETLRYLGKMDMKWLLWMAGRPSTGLLNTKAGSWGNFQWRTDGFGRFGLKGEQEARNQIEHFLQANPRCSFHTCCGGSRYAHQFEIQRYADVNYLSDMGRGEQTNHYFSYLEVPDKWLDLLEVLLQPGHKYNPSTGPGMLTMAPGWYLYADGQEQEQLRRLMEIYRYLRQEGVAGRWSHMMHPTITGDKDYYYDQRISYDGKRSCIILKHQPRGEVTIYPKGLLPEYNYDVGFECTKEHSKQDGAALMANGITLTNPPPGELIYLGLPGLPGFVNNGTAPRAPGRALARRETNIGHSGVGIYWSPVADDDWISYYEVRRGEEVIGKASTGTYYFDHAPGWSLNALYSVRTVGGGGLTSAWTPVMPLEDGLDAYAALGGHFAEAGREGWSAETSTDGIAFTGMTWVPPAKSPAGDTGGTPNQPGGVEGYWEGPGQARVGRGWQQASPEAACVRAWTAPKAGTVNIVGRAMKECYRQGMGGPLRVRILLGDSQVWPEQGWSEVRINDLQGIMHDFSLDIAAGDTIRFVLERGASPDTDIIAWMPRIIYTHQTPLATGSCVRILCGSEMPYTDRTGNVWSQDVLFTGGETASTTTPVANALPTADDGVLYQQGRTGRDFTYTIPVESGLYTLRLKFAETTYQWSFERPFNLSINGRCMLQNLDICQAARGPNAAYDRVFHYLVPDENGQLVLRFNGGFEPLQKTDEALIQAIEVLPEIRQAVRIDAGAESNFVDWNSFIWTADTGFDGGAPLYAEGPVSQASPTLYDQALYQTARSGREFRYSIPVPPGVYAVHLKFAELWLKDLQQRPMNIIVNGHIVRSHWDPAQAAGQVGMAADIRVEDVTPDKNNLITIHISATGNNDAILQGIEIE